MSYSSTSCIINFTSNPGPSRTTEPNVNVVHEACMLDNGGDRVEESSTRSPPLSSIQKMQQKPPAGPHPIYPGPQGSLSITIYPGPQGSLSIKRTPIVLDLLLVVPQKADLTAMHLLATLGLIIYKLCRSVLCIYNTPTGSIT